ncbi:MAG: DUF6364 family protein [Chloroflexota bacterium]
MAQSAKLTISLPKDTILFADKVAKERKISRSKVIAQFLQEAARKRLEAELEEGYRVMAKEHEEFARISWEAASEVVPPWD